MGKFLLKLMILESFFHPTTKLLNQSKPEENVNQQKRGRANDYLLIFNAKLYSFVRAVEKGENIWTQEERVLDNVL